MFVLVDTISRNVMGEFETFAEAKVAFLAMVASHPAAARELLILSDTGKKKSVPQQEIVAALEAVAG
jgi:hypothetical protein